MIDLRITDGATLVVTLSDGTTREIEGATRVCFREGAKRVARPRSVAKTATTYEVADVTKAECDALVRGDHDALEHTNESRDRLLKRLAFIARVAFKTEGSPTFSAQDSAFVASALKQGTKPSTLARALVAASRDKFWSDKGGIPFRILVRDAQALASRFDQAKASAKHALRRLLPAIEADDIIAHHDISTELPTMSEDDARRHLATWTRRLQTETT